MAEEAGLEPSHTDCMMLDGRFVFGIKCDWSNYWPQIHKDGRGNVTIFAIHNEYTMAAYHRFFELLQKECTDEYRKTSGDVFEMLKEEGWADQWFK